MELRSQNTPDFLNTVTRIKFPNQEGHASGFFYNWNNRGLPFLVTNKHVVRTEDRDGNQVESLRIFFRQSADNIDDIDYHDIELFTDGEEPRWREHPNDAVDIAVIPIETSMSGSKTLGTDHLLPTEYDMMPGQRLIVMGYPVTTLSPHHPISKSAYLASRIDRLFQGEPCFLVESNTHGGASGSPILTSPDTIFYSDGEIAHFGSGPYVLGVNEGMIDEPTEDIREGAVNLNRVWHIGLVDDIIEENI